MCYADNTLAPPFLKNYCVPTSLMGNTLVGQAGMPRFRSIFISAKQKNPHMIGRAVVLIRLICAIRVLCRGKKDVSIL